MYARRFYPSNTLSWLSTHQSSLCEDVTSVSGVKTYAEKGKVNTPSSPEIPQRTYADISPHT